MADSGERKPLLVQAGQGESVWSLGGRFTAKATATVTEQRFALVEAVAFQATEPPVAERYGIEVVGPPCRAR